ncbi:MAG TPA: VTT domain-containing protein [Polyangiaceae bacterium]|nr:VTT domain-containing protein [Polyangiaceae bacterium]
MSSRPNALDGRTVGIIVRMVVGLAALLVGVAVLSALFRSELEALGHVFVDRFGLWGMVIGSLVADGFHFLLPPQFYMLMGISSGVPARATLTAVCFGSFVGGWTAYFLATRIGRFEVLERRLAEPRRLLESALDRYGNFALVLVGFLPITYAALCYLAGLGRVSKRGFLIIALVRVPRLVAYYYLVRLGWLGV